MSTESEALAEIIWTTSRADESTISATGANIVARVILASDWLAKREAEAWDEGNAFAQGYDLHYHLDRDEWEEEPKSGPNPYRAKVES